MSEAHLTELQEEPKLEELSNEELGRVIAARWTGEDTTVHVPEERQDYHPAHEPIENQDNEADIDSDMEPEHDYSEDDEYTFDREEEQVPETRRVCQLKRRFISVLQITCVYCIHFQLQLKMC